jgi:hypothetical protein
MSLNHNEFELDLGDSPIRQGDVFKWDDEHAARPWYQYGVVVTADCDLAKNKTRGRLSYVPALTMEDYIWHFWRDNKFSSVQKAHISKFTSRLNTRLKKDGREDEVSEEAAQAWLQRAGTEGLLDEIGVTDKGQRLDLKKIADELVMLLSLLDAEEPNMALLQSCYAIKNAKATADDVTALALEIQSAISSLPGDVFFLPHVSDRPDEGLFLILRDITQCDISEIAIRPDELRFGRAKAKRLGRVAAPFRFAITQNLARVFSDIGLPESYEEKCKTSSHRFFGSRGLK